MGSSHLLNKGLPLGNELASRRAARPAAGGGGGAGGCEEPAGFVREGSGGRCDVPIYGERGLRLL